MKNRKFKTIIATVSVALTLGLSAAFGGCNALTPRDGIDGKDLNIYDIYAAAKAESGNPNMSFSDFLKEYFNYTSVELENAASLKASINRSLMSSVSIQAQFTENGSSVAYSGSGVIIDIDAQKGDMTVVTNCHVVYSAKAARYGQDGYSDNIYLWLYGSEVDYVSPLDPVHTQNAIPAQLIAASKTYDVAVLKVSGSDKISQARAATWTTSEEVYLGETVYAVGNANSQTMSANVGYISKDLERIQVDLGTTSKSDIYTYNVMRTSAAINSGNSGGGLYNLEGELVGLVNAKSKSDVTGFGYALTAASTKRVVQSMLDYYEAEGGEAHFVYRVNHGIKVSVTDKYSTGLNQSGLVEIFEKVEVKGTSLSSAASGKLSGGDVLKNIKITRGGTVVEDIAIKREHNFHDAMLSVRAGDTVEFTVERNQETVTQTITFGENSFELFDKSEE